MKPKLYTATFCPKCRQLHQWFPDAFEFVSVDNWGHEEIESAGLTALPTIETADGRKIYAGSMSKQQVQNCWRMLMDEALKKALSEGIVRLSFKKKDGTIREMRATTMPDVVQPLIKPNAAHRATNPDVCAVVDVEKNEFRSFRWNSIISWEA